MPDMNSSSESIPVVCVSGVSPPIAAAEAILLLERVFLLTVDSASAAFRFLDWEEMVTAV